MECKYGDNEKYKKNNLQSSKKTLYKVNDQVNDQVNENINENDPSYKEYLATIKILQDTQKISDQELNNIKNDLPLMSRNQLMQKYNIKYNTLVDIMKGRIFPLSSFTYKKYLKTPKEKYIIHHDQSSRKTKKRFATPNDIMFILNKTMENWSPIRIFNELKKTNDKITLDRVKKFARGTVFIGPSELAPTEYVKYKDLRQKCFQKHLNYKNN
jgi:hypothetical protein